MSLLASTMSMFDSSIWKNGHSRYIACSNAMPSLGRASSQASDRAAEPVPARQHQPALRPAEHPGDRAQILDALPKLCAMTGRLPMLRLAISPITVDSRKKSSKPSVS